MSDFKSDNSLSKTDLPTNEQSGGGFDLDKAIAVAGAITGTAAQFFTSLQQSRSGQPAPQQQVQPATGLTPAAAEQQNARKTETYLLIGGGFILFGLVVALIVKKFF